MSTPPQMPSPFPPQTPTQFPPTLPDANVVQPAVPPYTLHSLNAITLATFLGSPVAGAILMSLNYRRMGKPGPATVTLVLGILGTILLLGISMILPDRSPASLLAIGNVLAMWFIASKLQGDDIMYHEVVGGKIASRWKAAGIGILGLIIVFGGLIGYIMLTSGMPGKRLVVGTKDEIYYSGTATEAEAKSLGQGLLDDHYFTDKGYSVGLIKNSSGTTVSFVVADKTWDNAQMVEAFKTIVRDNASHVGGLPIKLKLMNTETDVKKEVDVK